MEVGLGRRPSGAENNVRCRDSLPSKQGKGKTPLDPRSLGGEIVAGEKLLDILSLGKAHLPRLDQRLEEEGMGSRAVAVLVALGCIDQENVDWNC